MSDKIQNHFYTDNCSQISKMVFEIILHNQMTKKIALELDPNICFWAKFAENY